jgi:hypothetical protein
MGGAINHYVLSARFMLTMGHMIAMLLVFFNLNTNVNASFGDNASSADINAAIASSQAALIIGLVCIAVDFAGLVFGTSVFSTMVNLWQILFHLVGGVMFCWLITDIWHYQTIWPIVLCASVPTVLLESWRYFVVKYIRPTG